MSRTILRWLDSLRDFLKIKGGKQNII